MIKAIVSLSGGMDSATVLAEALFKDRDCIAIGFSYGSKHNKYENKRAQQLAEYYEVPFQLIDLEGVMKGFKSNLMKGQGDIPEGHYEDESMSQTVVPARNIIFASILAGLAWSKECKEVWMGVHAGDHVIYPDCRPEFYVPLKAAIKIGTNEKVEIRTPFIIHSKAQILERGLELEVPYQLTRTCYKDQHLSCGKCGSCVERLEAFKANNVDDPIQYEEQ